MTRPGGRPHPWLDTVAGVPHGGAAAAGLLDLSASLAPLGPSPAALAAARDADPTRYPSPDAGPLVVAAAELLGVDPERVVAGPGAADLLLRAALAHLRPGDTVLVVGPCFGEYRRAAAACGARTVAWEADPGDGFALDTGAVAAAARRAGAVLGILARPQNPTGVLSPATAIAELAAATPGATWLVDEAFIGLCDDPSSTAGGEAVTVRSLTKELALAGLRVGVADAPPAVARALRALAPPWCVSAPAIAAAVAGLADRGHRDATLAAVRRGRAALTAALRDRGLHVADAAANYVCAEVGDAAGFCAVLAASGVVARDCADLRLPGWVRLAVPPPAALERVLAAVGAAVRR
ncbi:MAG TPA: aminotransferase class I/II-fold pyridoxal phosphate-dependent enzyme [Candidatus Dormibacteraeota bacterium]